MIIRPCVESDFPQMVSLYNANDKPQITLEMFLDSHRKRATRLAYSRLVALLPDGQLAGYASAGESEDADQHHFFVYVVVDKTHRGQGVGLSLLQKLAEWAKQNEAVCLEAAIEDDRSDVLEWAKKRGFITEGHATKSELQLNSWDASAYQDLLAPVHEHGIRFASLNDLGTTEENLFHLHQFCLEMHRHVPGRGPHLPPYESWRAKIKDDPAWDPSCVLLALDDERWMGVSFMERVSDGSLYTYLTAVHPDYRGRGLGNAIKTAAVQLAQKQGATYLSTWNHTINTAMLAVNRRLGYQPVEGVYQVHLPL